MLVAPGPYLCAETQAGGLPLWLIAKNIRIRHSISNFLRSFDPEYSKYSLEWYRHILPIFEKHQVTFKSNGCILALQIENEYFENLYVPLGLADEMRLLAKAARDLGITVPFFTNDGWEAGSYVAYPDDHRKYGLTTFGLDLVQLINSVWF